MLFYWSNQPSPSSQFGLGERNIAEITIPPTLSGFEKFVPLQQMFHDNFYFSKCSFFFFSGRGWWGGGGGGGAPALEARKGNFYMYDSSNLPVFSDFLQIQIPDVLLSILPLPLVLLSWFMPIDVAPLWAHPRQSWLDTQRICFHYYLVLSLQAMIYFSVLFILVMTLR